MKLKNLEIDNFALIPGPDEIPQPYSSVNVQSIAEYTSTEVADALLEIECIELQSTNSSSMWEWKATLKNSSANITIEMTCMGESDEHWGGFQLNGYGKKEYILKVWGALKAKGFIAVWLHDDECNMYTREGFLEAHTEYA